MARTRASEHTVPAGTVVIGAGPAGISCAIHAAAGGGSMLVLEKNRIPLVKLALSGAGRCNITHSGPMEHFLDHYGERGRFVKPALFGFTNDDLTVFLAGIGVETVIEEDGRVFPVSSDADDIREALTAECAARGVEMRYGEPVHAITGDARGFEVRTERGLFRAGTLVIATGGLSYPRTGSTGDGYGFARGFGHAIVETAPALAPVIVGEYRYAGCTGISIEDAGIVIRRDGKAVRRARGDVLFTHRGLSGPGILDLSRNLRRGDAISLSIGPFETAKDFREAVDRSTHEHGRRSLKHCLTSFRIPGRLAVRILELSGIDPSMKTSQADRATRDLIAERFTRLELTVASLGGDDEAMVTRGGVDTGGIDRRTMESRPVPGLYIIGETLDVDGDTGGYNLQWAFSSGALAGREIAGRASAVSP